MKHETDFTLGAWGRELPNAPLDMPLQQLERGSRFSGLLLLVFRLTRRAEVKG
jgi:hypothetical protein